MTNNNSFVSHKYTLVPFKNTPLMCALSVSPSFIGLTCSVFRSLQDFVFTSVVHVSHVNAMSMPCQYKQCKHVDHMDVSCCTELHIRCFSQGTGFSRLHFLLHQVTGPCSNRPCVDWMVKGICHRLAVYHVNLYDAEYRECVRLCNLCTNMYRTCILLLYLSSDAFSILSGQAQNNQSFRTKHRCISRRDCPSPSRAAR